MVYRFAHRHVRAQDLCAGLHLGHQLVRCARLLIWPLTALADDALRSFQTRWVSKSVERRFDGVPRRHDRKLTQETSFARPKQLGKVLAKNILGQLDDASKVQGHDSSTTGLIKHYINRL